MRNLPNLFHSKVLLSRQATLNHEFTWWHWDSLSTVYTSNTETRSHTYDTETPMDQIFYLIPDSSVLYQITLQRLEMYTGYSYTVAASHVLMLHQRHLCKVVRHDSCHCVPVLPVEVCSTKFTIGTIRTCDKSQHLWFFLRVWERNKLNFLLSPSFMIDVLDDEILSQVV